MPFIYGVVHRIYKIGHTTISFNDLLKTQLGNGITSRH